ncbi:MAG: LytTR family DNA-binding domain-containing protein [Oscillospiraceae bacterium]|nr:LytTR family DNA-binding domain-containing protein [Oscillospiraceae bacterium]
MILSVFIVEDSSAQREYIEKIVCDHIAVTDQHFELALSVANPTLLLAYLEENQPQYNLYFLDVDLSHELNGIDLAAKVRERDPSGKIVFVTAHTSLSYLTFHHHIESMDYIVKNQPAKLAQRIRECMDIAYKRFFDTSYEKEQFQVKTRTDIRNIPVEDIMFFEAQHMSHKLILHMNNEWIEFYGSLDDVVKFSPDLYLCHKAFVVNTKNIKSINKIERTVELVNGEIVPVGRRRVMELFEHLSNNTPMRSSIEIEHQF